MGEDEKWMKAALEEAAQAAAEGEIPVGAVLVRGGQVIAAAHNLREQTQDPTAHAEMLCLRAAAEKLGGWRMNGCTLYVTMEPCPMCAGAMLMSRLSRCVWGAADPKAGCCGSVYDLPGDPALGGVTRWTPDICGQEARKLLNDFFNNKRIRKEEP